MSYTNGLGNTLASTQQLFGTSAAAETSKADQSAATKTSSPAPAGDQANLSTTGNLISQALSGSDVRSEKVAALQQSIAAGTYSVPASAVAEKLISSLLK